jgi:hypothetical protein
MSYLIAYDSNESSFISKDGIESMITLTPEVGCDYYLVEKESFVVKLINGWIPEDGCLGELVTNCGEIISQIPHPGTLHGKLRIAGMVEGDSEGLKFIIESFKNSSNYFLYYKISNKLFTGAGNTVR